MHFRKPDRAEVLCAGPEHLGVNLQTDLIGIEPAQRMARFYREWGRIGQGGQVRMDWFADEAQAIAALIKLEAAKRRRGYRVEP